MKCCLGGKRSKSKEEVRCWSPEALHLYQDSLSPLGLDWTVATSWVFAGQWLHWVCLSLYFWCKSFTACVWIEARMCAQIMMFWRADPASWLPGTFSVKQTFHSLRSSFPKEWWPTRNEGFPGGSVVKNLPAMQETHVRSLGWEDALEKEMVTCSSISAWEIPWTEGPGGLQSMGLQKVRYD